MAVTQNVMDVHYIFILYQKGENTIENLNETIRFNGVKFEQVKISKSLRTH